MSPRPNRGAPVSGRVPVPLRRRSRGSSRGCGERGENERESAASGGGGPGGDVPGGSRCAAGEPRGEPGVTEPGVGGRPRVGIPPALTPPGAGIPLPRGRAPAPGDATAAPLPVTPLRRP